MGYGALSFAAMAVLGIVSSIVIARLYGIEVIGEFALATAPVGTLWLLSTTKEQVALVRELASLPPRAPRVTALWTAVLAFSTGLTVVVASLAALAVYFLYRGPIDRPDLFLPAVACLGGYVLITNLGWNFDGIYSAFLAGRRLFWIRLHETMIQLLLSVAGGLLVGGVWALIVATYAAAFTSLVHRIIAVRPYMRFRVTRSELLQGFSALPELVRFGLKITPGNVLGGLSPQIGVWLLGAMSSIVAVGAYNRAQVLSRRLGELTTRIVEMLLPTLALRWTAGDREGFDRALSDTMRYALIFMLLLAAMGAGAAHGIMALFGEGFGRAADAFAVIMLVPALAALSRIQSQALFTVDRPWITSLTAAVRLLCTVLVTYAATLRFGILGPPLGLVYGTALDVIARQAYLRPYIKTPLRELWPVRQMLALVPAYGLAVAVGRGAEAAVTQPLSVLLSVPLAAIVYLMVLLSLGGLNERDRERLRPLLARARRLGRDESPSPRAAFLER